MQITLLDCLKTLTFEEIALRRSAIVDAAEGTNEWIWSHPEYQEWESESSGILWIQGKPGSGKSVLAKTIQTRLGKETQDLVCSWFYSRDFGQKAISHDSLLKAFLQQMLSREANLFSVYQDVYRNLPSGEWPRDAMQTVLVRIANSGKKLVCIVDAMDESSSDEGSWSRQDLLYFLDRLAFEAPASNAKIIVLSRPIQEDEYFQYRCYRIILQDSNQADIRRLVEIGLESIHHVMHSRRDNKPGSRDNPFQSRMLMRKKKQLQRAQTATRQFALQVEAMGVKETQVLNEIRDYVISNAQGVTLWAGTVMDEMLKLAESPTFSFYLLRDEVLRMPDNLTELYAVIVEDLVRHLSLRKRALARKAVMWVFAATRRRPICLHELWDALAIPPDASQISADPSTADPFENTRLLIRASEDCSPWFQVRQSLLELCGSLLDIAPPEPGLGGPEDIGPFHIVQLLHGTVREFLLSHKSAGFLKFQSDEAEELVKNDSQTYVKAVLSRPEPAYSAPLPSQGAGRSPDWYLNASQLIHYLNDKFLLSFALDHTPQVRRHISERYRHLVEVTLSPPFSSWPPAALDNLLGDQVLLYHQFPGLDRHKAAIVGRYFRDACRVGYAVTVRNLLSILTSMAGWWEEFADVVLNAALLAAVEANLTDVLPELTEEGRHRGLHLCPRRLGMEDFLCSDLSPTLWEASRTGSVEATMFLYDQAFAAEHAYLRPVWLWRVMDARRRVLLVDGGEVVEDLVDKELVRMAIQQILSYWRSRDDRYRRKWDLTNTPTDYYLFAV